MVDRLNLGFSVVTTWRFDSSYLYLCYSQAIYAESCMLNADLFASTSAARLTVDHLSSEEQILVRF